MRIFITICYSVVTKIEMKMKKNYLAPVIELVEFNVEQGFAVTPNPPGEAPTVTVSNYSRGHIM